MTFLVNYPRNKSNRLRYANYHESYPAVNISESEDGWKLSLAVPGLNKEDFKVEVKERKLSISYEDASEDTETGKGYSRKEFGFKSFKRSFLLPETVDASKISASYKQGVLDLYVPKKEEAKPELISVEIA